MSKKICVFSHKEGVGKTTTSYHLAWMLTEFGKKVLMVDSDSQCNLTNIVFGDEAFEQFYAEKPTSNLKGYLSPAFEAKPVLLEADELIPVKNNQRLFIIPGSFEISEYEVSLGISFTLSDALTSLKNLPGSFHYLIERTAEAHAIDYVIIDMNPSLSAINQALLVSSDYFIVPAAPDNFSVMAIKSLSKTIPKWEKWAKRARTAFSDAIFPLPRNTPKFIGTVMQEFHIRNGHSTDAQQKLIDGINDLVTSTFVPSMEESGMLLPKDRYNFEHYCLARIPSFHTLHAAYQSSGVPVYALTDEQLKHTGKVLESNQEMRQNFHAIFSDFAGKVLALTS